jgi:hypothetical protein
VLEKEAGQNGITNHRTRRLTMKSEPPFYVQTLKIGKGKLQMAKTTMERIAEAQEKINRDENNLKLFLRQQKEEERKARTNRICKRGGLLESLLPGTSPLADEQFKAFLLKTTANDYGERILAAVIAKSAEPAAENGGVAAVRGGLAPEPKPTGAEPASGPAGAAKAPEAAKQAAAG